MTPRTCFLWVWIANDAGKACRYTLKPLPPAELARSVAAFRLVNQSKFPNPVYVVRLAVDGQATCDCPQHNFAGKCKHADALLAAGVLPSALVGLLQERTRLLDKAEADLAAVSARAVQLQNAVAAIPPARPSRRRVAKSQAA